MRGIVQHLQDVGFNGMLSAFILCSEDIRKTYLNAVHGYLRVKGVAAGVAMQHFTGFSKLKRDFADGKGLCAVGSF